jgi:predicted PhzF superfamily epimerase YddE/YHI9
LNTFTVYHYDAFSEKPNKGNLAGVVISADGLSDEQMQEINRTGEVLVEVSKNESKIKVTICGTAVFALVFRLGALCH